MSRPYQRYQVTELEALVNGPGVLISQLHAIDAELEFRSTLLASNLRSAVQKRLKALAQKPASLVQSPTSEPQVRPQLRTVEPNSRPDEWRVTSAPAQSVPAPISPGPVAPAQPAPLAPRDIPVKIIRVPTSTSVPTVEPAKAHAPPPTVKGPLGASLSSPVASTEATEPTLAMSLEMTVEQAYRTLKVTALASWETIEGARRQLVALSQPDKIANLEPAKRKALLAEARTANLAYKVLLNARA